MKKIMRKRKDGLKPVNRGKGFTLVEIIVTLVILAVVSAIATPALLGYIDRGKAKECQATMDTLAADIASAKMAYEIDGVVEINGSEGGDVDESLDIENYIKEAEKEGLKCPSGGTYQLSSEGDEIECSVDGHGKSTIKLDGEKYALGPVTLTKRETPDSEAESSNTSTESEDEKKEPDELIAPRIEVTLDWDSWNLKERESKALTATVKVFPEDTKYQISWSCDAPDVLQCAGNTETVNLSALAAGNATITCTATTIPTAGEKSVSDDAQAYVSVQADSVTPTIKVSLSWLDTTLYKGEYQDLSAEVQVEPSDVEYTLSWSAGNPSVISYSDQGKQTVRVNALAAGNSAITCTAITKGEKTVSSSAQAHVVVQEAGSDEGNDLLADVQQPFLINGGLGGIQIDSFEKVKGGIWTSSDSSIVECPPPKQPENVQYNKWLVAHRKGTCQLTYTVNGKSVTIEVTVVYPHTSLELLGENGQQINSYVDQHIGDTTNITAQITAYKSEINNGETTDGPVRWGYDNHDVIDLVVSGENHTVATVTAKKVGSAKIWAELTNGYTGEVSHKEFTINVVYNEITGMTIESPIEIDEGETRNLAVSFEPSENIDTTDVTLKCDNYSSQNVSVEIQGLTVMITGLQATGNTDANIRIYAEKKGMSMGSVQRSCQIKVNRSAPQKVSGPNGTMFGLASWDELKAHIKKGTVSSLPLSNLYAVTGMKDGIEAVETLYIRKQDSIIEWQNDFENMMFAEFMQKSKNQDAFIEVKIDVNGGADVTGWYEGTVGAFVCRNGKYYVCVKEFANTDTSTWSEQMWNEYFIEIPVLAQ